MSPAARISIIYVIVGSAWIIASDFVLELLVGQIHPIFAAAQTIKGWLFVAVTASVLYFLLKREFDARERSEQKVLEREARFHTLFSASPLPMWIYDRKSLEFIDVNEAACTQYGYSREEFLATHVNELHLPDDLPQLIHYLSQAHPGYHFSGEFHHLTRDKRVIEVNTSANVLDFGGREAVLVAIQDIAVYKSAEAERLENERLRLTLAQEAELNNMRSRFISMVSHEFRRPLTTVTASVELLEHYRARMTDDSALKHFSRIHEQIGEMKELLDDFLTLMRDEAEEHDFKAVPVDLTWLCGKLSDELRLSAKDRHTITYTTDCESIVIDGDEKLLRHAVGNLLSNAVKYSPDGGEIRLEMKRGKNIEIHVTDQGMGIPAEDRAHIFDPFFRARNVGELSGTGLGLPIAQRAAEAHGGTLTISRSDASGTEFVITLPVDERTILTGC